jgi:hypothetical protein
MHIAGFDGSRDIFGIRADSLPRNAESADGYF